MELVSEEAAEEEGPGPSLSPRMRKKALTAVADWKRRMLQEMEESKEDWSDIHAVHAARFREDWESVWGDVFGSFEEPTHIGPRRYTDEDLAARPVFARIRDAIQIFSVKITGLQGGLQWPLHVFGFVALRDCVDHRRNTVFSRNRVNCQTLTQECPYLELTGPTRAVVTLDPVVFEVDLKVKGSDESEDKHLSFLAVEYNTRCITDSYLINTAYTSKHSTLELAFGHVVHSVEATIDMQVVNGTWPDGFHGLFTASTASIDKKILLLDSGKEEVPVTANGMIELTRSVASVELLGELKVHVVAENKEKEIIQDDLVFRPKEARRSCGMLNVSSCEIEVTIAWSLLSMFPDD